MTERLIPATEYQAYFLGRIEKTMSALQFVSQIFTEQQTDYVEVYDSVGEIKFSADEEMRQILAGGMGGLLNELVFEVGEWTVIDNPDLVKKDAQEHIIFDGENYQAYPVRHNKQMDIAANDIITRIKHAKFRYNPQT